MITSGSPKALQQRRRSEFLFRIFCMLVTLSSVLILCVLLGHIFAEGWNYLKIDLFTNFPSRFPDKAGIKSALVGTLWIMGLTALISIPIGVASAIYLEEYAPKSKLTRFIELNIANLAATPSILYGLFGLALFVRFFGLGRSLWSGALTLSLLILPTIIIATREALRGVPDTIRQGAYAVGATLWQTVWGQVLPSAIPGIMTGIILALSRAIGESAPLVMIGALAFVAFLPTGPSDKFATMPMQIFNWSSRPQEEFHKLAAAAIIVLLGVMLAMNAFAIWLRIKTQRKQS